MTPRLRRIAWIPALLASLATVEARAASLKQVTNWGASGVPTYVSMYIYVPDKMVTNPPILVVSHYCTGDAAGMFSQAQTGGVVAASDQYGFIMIFPQNHLPGTTRNCWDVGSKESLTHDGGGDTQAIAQMVKYTVTQYKANANRVYATGSSSGAMMTQALLAVYPDIFKAGAEFSGVPAGCWADGYASSNQWSGNCADGKTTFTAAQWGDKARAMYPGYTGRRPRIQLWHGDADETINPNNFTEAIKQWTNVLGLATDPTTKTMVTLSGKSWTRQSWQDSCGYTVLDTWLEKGGVHNIDANLNAQYIIPFFGLDKTGDVDPQVAACSGNSGGATGAGGTSGNGNGGTTAGGSSAAGNGGVGGARPGSGGNGAGGASGGRNSGGGGQLQGGSANQAGGNGSSGAQGNGAQGNGGNATAGSVGNNGGQVGLGGAIGAGGVVNGNSGAAGSGVIPSAGVSSSGSDSSGCSCVIGQSSHPTQTGVVFAALALAASLRRRRRHQ